MMRRAVTTTPPPAARPAPDVTPHAGLSNAEAAGRLVRFGPNVPAPPWRRRLVLESLATQVLVIFVIRTKGNPLQ